MPPTARSNSTNQPQGRVRHRIAQIRLEPPTSKHAISLKVLVDDQEVRRSPEVAAGRSLLWADAFECSVLPTSRINIRVYENRMWKRSRIGSVEYIIPDVAGRLETSLECDTRRFTVILSLSGPEPNMEVVAKAMAGLEGIERHKRVLKSTVSTKNAILKILDAGRTAAELVPMFAPAMSAFADAWNILEDQKSCDTSIETLVEGMSNIIPYVEVVQKAARLPHLRETILRLVNLIEDASHFIIDYKMDGRAVWSIRRIIGSNAQEQVDILSQKLKELKEEFDRGVRIQMLLDGKVNSCIHGSQYITPRNPALAQHATLNELKPVEEARYDPVNACLPGTRAQIIQEVVQWCTSPDTSEDLLWICGHAGFGKSAIATSVCKSLDEHGNLAVSFFCICDDPQRRDPQRLLTSIAHGLASRHPVYADAVVTAINQHNSVCNLPMQAQYEKLFVVPLQLGEVLTSPPYVIVVDGLDECGTEETRQQLLDHLHGLSQLVSRLRIVVISRPDSGLKNYFNNLAVATRDLSQFDAFEDIVVLVRQRLLGSSHIAESLPHDTTWKLAKEARGVFLWAQVALNIILEALNPAMCVDMILQGAGVEQTLDPLDALYTAMMKQSIGAKGERQVQAAKESLGAIIACSAHTPLPINALTELLRGRVAYNVLRSVIKDLSPVLYVDEKRGGAIRVRHRSFVDFISSSTRSKHFCIDVEQQTANSLVSIFAAKLSGLS
ncbi:POC1 centriolar protein A [Ceratobasidium sp. UAMH 11750]|nr:POC1 centriolar protein A [Ceratobasidium sp. UAMH 11750]